MTILDRIFSDSKGRDLVFTGGVEVGIIRGRIELAELLIRTAKQKNGGNDHGMEAFITAALVKLQRGEA
ncbi:MAG: hypothetical protein Q7T97_02405 [Burkholderiaceae bacterium]|nr:hypothetical protein [Burkholderiaceae bacterium]